MPKAKEELVEIELFKDHKDYKDDVFVAVNGKGMQIKRGVKVEIPKSYAEVLKNSMAQDKKTAEMMERKQGDFLEESANRNML